MAGIVYKIMGLILSKKGDMESLYNKNKSFAAV